MQSTRWVSMLLALWAVLGLGLAGCVAPASISTTASSQASNVTAGPTDAGQAAAPVGAIKVFAPSSLTDAAQELAKAYEAEHPGVKVAIEFGHTPTQRLQLTKGATGDVFISAGQKDMNDAIADGSVAKDRAKVFATNQLVVVLPAKNAANLQNLEDLARPGTKLLIAVADTPIGKVTLDSLDKMDKQFGPGFKAKVQANVVSQESGVKPIVSKVKLGEADAGIVYVTDAVAAPDLKTISVPAGLNVVSQLNVAPLAKSEHADQAAAFAAYLVSPGGQSILKKWGFLPAQS